MSFALTRRAILAGFAVTPALLRAQPAPDIIYVQDFDELWHTLAERYCYFGEKTTDWDRVRALYRPQAVAAATSGNAEAIFISVVRRMLNELYDPHTHLSDPPDGSPRWPLYDMMAQRRERGRVYVTDLRAGSAAAEAGVRIGDRVIAVDGQPVETLIALASPRCLSRPDPVAEAYAVNSAVAGRRGQPRRLRWANHGREREAVLPLRQGLAPADLEARLLPGNIGLITIRSFGDTALIDQFDTMLERFRETRGLIIDVRDNGGGDTAVARPIIGRFITSAAPYARMRRREGAGLSAAWTESVEPRGPFTYTAPVVVLTGHWSASMAEGFPMGMRGLGRARIVGSEMMQLGAAVFGLTLDRTGLRLQYSAEPVYDVWDRPRAEMRPDAAVAPGGDALATGLVEIERMIAP